MTIIDSQVHIYEANTPKRPWHSVPNWPDHVTGDEMAGAQSVRPICLAVLRLITSLRRRTEHYH